MSISDGIGSTDAGAPLDAALIARLANDFFAALPGHSGPPAGSGVAAAPPAIPPVEIGALPVAVAVPPSSAVGNLNGSELRSAPATLSGAKLPLPQAGLSPSVLSGPYEFRPTLLPAEEAPAVPAAPVGPPLESGLASTASPAIPAAPGSAPTEAELRALPGTLAEHDPDRTSLTASGAPAVSYYFLDPAQAPRPSSVPVVPAGDDGFDPAMLPELALVAGPYDPRLGRDFPR